MTIRCIYVDEPRFPASDQHPKAARFKVQSKTLGKTVFVDALDGEPTSEEVDAILNQPHKERTVEEKLACMGLTIDELRKALG